MGFESQYFTIVARSSGNVIKKAHSGTFYYSLDSGSTWVQGTNEGAIAVEAGDKVFSELEEMAKDSYLGPMWRARIQTILDPENPIESVKECYDKVYERLASKDESYNTERKECLVYSAFYYFKKDDYDAAKDYCEKVLAIDPNHGLAKNILNAIAQLKK